MFEVNWVRATWVALLIVLVCTLVPLPFRVDRPAATSLAQVLAIGFGPDRSSDIVENIVLFLPLGFALAGNLTQRGTARLSAIATILLFSAACSYAIEVVQQFIPGRFSSLTDVLANTTGGTLGFLLHRLWYRHSGNF